MYAAQWITGITVRVGLANDTSSLTVGGGDWIMIHRPLLLGGLTNDTSSLTVGGTDQ